MMLTKTEAVRMTVGGMSCMHCAARVEAVLKALGGVKKVDVRLETGAVEVHFVPGKVSAAAFVEAVEKAGYTAELIK